MKIIKHAWAILAITLVAVVALMFLIPFNRTTTWWIAACCTVLMFGVCAFSFARAFNKDRTLESKVLGWPIFRVGYVALIIQLIVGTVLMITSKLCSPLAASIIEIIVFALVGICLIVRDAVREVVSASEGKNGSSPALWKSIRLRASELASTTDDENIKKLGDMIRFADPTTTSIDGEIYQILESLHEHRDSETVNKALALMEKRKAYSKSEKNH